MALGLNQMLPTGWHCVKNTIAFDEEEVASIYNIFYPENVFRKRNTGGWAQIDEIMGDTPFSSFDLFPPQLLVGRAPSALLQLHGPGLIYEVPFSNQYISPGKS